MAGIITGVLFLLTMLLPCRSAAIDGRPFIHEFGELRVYCNDWLTVCEEKGEGTCRTATFGLEPGQTFFSESELTVYPAQGGRPASVEFFHRGAPSPPEGDIIVQTENRIFELRREDFHLKRTPLGTPILETYEITDPRIVPPLIRDMLSGRWIYFSYDTGDRLKTVKFSLLGLSRALGFIGETSDSYR